MSSSESTLRQVDLAVEKLVSHGYSYDDLLTACAEMDRAITEESRQRIYAMALSAVKPVKKKEPE